MAVFTFPGQIIPIQAMKEIHIEKCTETVKENCFTEPLNAVFPPDDLVTHLRCTNGPQTRTAIFAAAQILHQTGCDLRFICARHSRCATQNCRSATSGKAVDVGSVASSAKREQIAVQEIAPVGVVDLSVQEHVIITAQSARSHIERPLVAVKEKGVRAQFASIENHFFDGNLQKKQTNNIVTHLYNPT